MPVDSGNSAGKSAILGWVAVLLAAGSLTLGSLNATGLITASAGIEIPVDQVLSFATSTLTFGKTTSPNQTIISSDGLLKVSVGTFETGPIELGHASDTTIARSGAGAVTVEGNALYLAGGTDVPVADGGTGRSSHTEYAVICGGTTTTAAQQSIASVGTSGHVLTSNGAGLLPTFQAASGGVAVGDSPAWTGVHSWSTNSTVKWTMPALSGTFTGARTNVAGAGAGAAMTSADDCTIIGDAAGDGITTSDGITLLGSGAGGAAAGCGADCTFIGKNVGLLATGITNVGVGSGTCLDSLTSGVQNTVIGYNAGSGVTTTNNTTAMGYGCLTSNNSSDSTAFGAVAGDGCTTSAQSCFFGKDAGGAAGGTDQDDVVLLGYQAGLLNTGDWNVAVGSGAMDINTAGVGGVFIGKDAGGTTAQTGNYNIAIGYNCDVESSSTTESITLGTSAVGSTNTFVAGGSFGEMTNVYFGEGMTNATPLDYTIHGCGGSGTDIAGKDCILGGGLPTGNALGGKIAMQFPLQSASTATTLRSLSTQKYRLGGNLFCTTDSTTVTASVVDTVETTLITTVNGSVSVEAGVLAAGRLIRWRISGVYTSSAVPVTYNIRIKKGSVTLASTGAITPPVSQTASTWTWQPEVIVRTFGATGPSQSSTPLFMQGASNACFIYGTATNAAVVCTSTEDLGLTIQYSGNTAGNSITTDTVSVDVEN